MRCTLAACQPCVQPFAKDAIICIGDYGFVDEIGRRLRQKQICGRNSTATISKRRSQAEE